MRRVSPLLALASLTACTGPSGPSGPIALARPDPELVRVIALAADQVRRCYRTPPGARGGRGIVTTLRVAYAPDGTLAGLPALLDQRGVTPGTEPAARALAEAAALAVIRCVPLTLPAARYRGGWDSFDLTFGPRAVA